MCQMEHQDLTLLCRDLRSKDKRPLNASMREDGYLDGQLVRKV